MLLIYIFAIIFLNSGIHVSYQSEESTWAYTGDHGPDKWGPGCTTGKYQSPIDIVPEFTIKKDLGSLKFTRYDFAFEGEVLNNGHTVQVTFSGVPLFLNGGGLSATYQFEQMHLHWGAEHTIDGHRDAMELHLVHFEKKYGNVSNAAEHKNGIAVIAVLFKLSDEYNKDLEPIVEATEIVGSQWVGPQKAKIQRKIIPQLLLPKDKTSFYRYQGSLTTPDCKESVTWFVFTEKLTVSQDQLSVFQQLETPSGPLEFNYRPVQPAHDRKVYHHLLGYSSDSRPLSIADLLRKYHGLPTSLGLKLYLSENPHDVFNSKKNTKVHEKIILFS